MVVAWIAKLNIATNHALVTTDDFQRALRQAQRPDEGEPASQPARL